MACLVDHKPSTLQDCVVWARLQFETQFTNRIKQLLHNFPKDSVLSTGMKFWSGPKRAPAPIEFDANDPVHVEFIAAAASMYAQTYGLKPASDLEFYRDAVQKVKVPAFVPKVSGGLGVPTTHTTPITPTGAQEGRLSKDIALVSDTSFQH